jgi:3',5'-cyclic AMP phosphodiesterase CpdA
MNVILPVVYLGNIEYYSLLKNAEEVFFDLHGHYLKQNFRNRTEIYGANGKLDLIIPVEKHKNHTALGDIKISYDHFWQKQHWKSIASAYRSSPYFEFYEDEMEEIFMKKYTHLVEFNLALQTKILECLSLSPKVTFSKEHLMTIEGFTNYRGYFTPKQKSLEVPKEPYNQVFEDKYGFIPNLFILDLLFNEGPNSINFL